MSKSADAFRTISEVAEWLETPAHVLRFWESKFSQVKPVKRAGGRRYYRPNDMLLLGGIKKLLHNDGMTIKGVQKLLREQGVKHVAGHSQELDDVTAAEASEIEIENQAVEPPSGKVLDFKQEGAPPPLPEMKDTSIMEPALPSSKSEVPEAHDDDVAYRTEPPQPAPDVAEIAAPDPRPEPEHTADAVPETEVEETAPPAMPSFVRHRSAQAADSASLPDTETVPTSAPLKPAAVTVPSDPADDLDADPGVLTQIAGLADPIDAALAKHFSEIIDRLRQSPGT